MVLNNKVVLHRPMRSLFLYFPSNLLANKIDKGHFLLVGTENLINWLRAKFDMIDFFLTSREVREGTYIISISYISISPTLSLNLTPNSKGEKNPYFIYL